MFIKPGTGLNTGVYKTWNPPGTLLKIIQEVLLEFFNFAWVLQFCFNFTTLLKLYLQYACLKCAFNAYALMLMLQSILALPPPPGICNLFFARWLGINGTCKVVPGAGNCLPAGHLSRLDVSATNMCYYIKMESKLLQWQINMLVVYTFPLLLILNKIPVSI